MYPNVRAEMARQNITVTVMAREFNKSVSAMSTKLRKGRITFSEAVKIKKILGTDLPLEVLFEEAV